MRKSTEPALLELATGAGKSWIAAAIALWITKNKKGFSFTAVSRTHQQNYENI